MSLLHSTYQRRRLRLPGGAYLGRPLSFAADAVPASAVQPGTTLQEDDPRLFVVSTNRQLTLAQSSAQGPDAVWHLEFYVTYLGGQGAYTVQTGAGVELLVYSPAGCYVQFAGFANANGGLFEIRVDGVFQVYGDCHAPSATRVSYHSPLWVPAGLHVITTAKVSGAAHYADEVAIFN